MAAGNPAGIGAIGGGYLQTIVIISSPSISRPGWNRTTILFVKTRCGSCFVPHPFNGNSIL